MGNELVSLRLRCRVYKIKLFSGVFALWFCCEQSFFLLLLFSLFSRFNLFRQTFYLHRKIDTVSIGWFKVLISNIWCCITDWIRYTDAQSTNIATHSIRGAHFVRIKWERTAYNVWKSISRYRSLKLLHYERCIYFMIACIQQILKTIFILLLCCYYVYCY